MGDDGDKTVENVQEGNDYADEESKTKNVMAAVPPLQGRPIAAVPPVQGRPIAAVPPVQGRPMAAVPPVQGLMAAVQPGHLSVSPMAKNLITEINLFKRLLASQKKEFNKL